MRVVCDITESQLSRWFLKFTLIYKGFGLQARFWSELCQQTKVLLYRLLIFICIYNMYDLGRLSLFSYFFFLVIFRILWDLYTDASGRICCKCQRQFLSLKALRERGTYQERAFCLKYIGCHLSQSASEPVHSFHGEEVENTHFPGNNIYLLLKYYPCVWKVDASISIFISKIYRAVNWSGLCQ